MKCPKAERMKLNRLPLNTDTSGCPAKELWQKMLLQGCLPVQLQKSMWKHAQPLWRPLTTCHVAELINKS